MLFGPTTTARGSDSGGVRRGDGCVTAALSRGPTAGVDRGAGRSLPSVCPGATDDDLRELLEGTPAAPFLSKDGAAATTERPSLRDTILALRW
jgi:hypothetical protein